ncbi:MAG: FAD-dependent oxidoreductase [Pirellulaceae bacterium]|nr:FAD-dependent oxidoreductase [Pirellulaceae bacterium]
MRIAIVGGGVSGNVCAWLLHPDHDVTLFEAADYLGGHTNTIEVQTFDAEYTVDTGFMVFNNQTYPQFIRLLELLGVPHQLSDMSFSVRCERSGLEYQGSSLNGLFAQRLNLFNPRFYWMLKDVLRFNRQAPRFLRLEDDVTTLGEYLTAKKYGSAFIQNYLIPMTAAIWSARPHAVLEMPARFLIAFFLNHGLLQAANHPPWRTISGGARTYVKAIADLMPGRIRLNSPIESVRRHSEHVVVKPVGSQEETFDEVIFATHADQTLRMLSDATDQEKSVLGSFDYQRNMAVLHTDSSLLPLRKRAWASWNYHIPQSEDQPVAVTYDLNRLQSLGAPAPICVTLNHVDQIDPSLILGQMEYEHPVFGSGTIEAQRAHRELNGRHRTHFCGAYWGYGFHEDGVRSALVVGESFGKTLESCTVASTTGSCDTVVSSQ